MRFSSSKSAGPGLVLAVAPLFLASVAAGAGTSTTSTGTSSTATNTIAITGTSLPEIVTETEPCAILCYDGAAEDSGCHPADFSCVCGNPASLVVKMGLCVGKDCDDSKQFDSGDWLADLCFAYSSKPPSAAISSASSIIMSEISAAAATATTNPVPTSAISIDSTAAATTTSGSSSAAASLSAPFRLPGLTPVAAGFLGGAILLGTLLL